MSLISKLTIQKKPENKTQHAAVSEFEHFASASHYEKTCFWVEKLKCFWVEKLKVE